ncbi:Uncharacterized protein Adt_06357 [Abeliophyllum distichum]|uniref:Putative plant transposon protein domain-containing protein n=1 Tax=Abeliophyllum distichum TaxID=126358 RepID=A0ABD1V6R2_9LAMI
MPQTKMVSKRLRERPPSLFSENEAPSTKNWIDKYPIHIVQKQFFTLKDITLLKRVLVSPEKHFEEATRLSTNQLTLSCRVLHNIISHIIIPRKGHLDEVNHFDVFLLDSILVGCKLDFPYIMLNHMNTVYRAHRPIGLPYGMILTKIFQHFEVSFCDEVVLSPKPIDTINIRTLRRIKIFKEDRHWVAKSRGFDDESGLSTLPFEGGEEMDADEDDPPPRPRSHRPSFSTSGFTSTEDHFNLINGRIDSLTSMVEGLYHTAEGLCNTMGTLQQSMDGKTLVFQALHSRLDSMIPPPPPPET